MKRLFAGLWALPFLALVSLTIPVHAQTAASTPNSARPFSYNVSEEVTLKGSVMSVLMTPARGMIMGSHLLISTPSGTVDASLGTFGLRGKGSLSVKVGDQIEMTGILKTMKNKPVFLTRLVKADNHVYTIRNERGFPVSPQARERLSQKSAPKAEAL
jgi:hypothetical protein